MTKLPSKMTKLPSKMTKLKFISCPFSGSSPGGNGGQAVAGSGGMGALSWRLRRGNPGSSERPRCGAQVWSLARH